MSYKDRHIDDTTASLSFEYDGFIFIAEFEYHGRYSAGVSLHLGADHKEIAFYDVEDIVRKEIYDMAEKYADQMADEIQDAV